MDKEITTPINSLMKTDKCSPLVVYFIFIVVSLITMFNTHWLTKKLDNYKISNIFNLHAWYEISYLILLGVILYGLCQYNHETLAWIILFFPLVTYVIKTALVFSSVSTVLKQIPPEHSNGQLQAGNFQPSADGSKTNYGGNPSSPQAQTTSVNNLLTNRQSNMGNQNSAMTNKLDSGMMPPLASNTSDLSGFSF